MAMRPCQKCLENNWSFRKLDGGYIEATCNLCGYTVEFVSRRKELKEGGQCRKCDGTLSIKQLKFKPKKLNKLYYYTAVYVCDMCKTSFYSNEFKVENKKVTMV